MGSRRGDLRYTVQIDVPDRVDAALGAQIQALEETLGAARFRRKQAFIEAVATLAQTSDGTEKP